jgi:hypothetical protein
MLHASPSDFSSALIAAMLFEDTQKLAEAPTQAALIEVFDHLKSNENNRP